MATSQQNVNDMCHAHLFIYCILERVVSSSILIIRNRISNKKANNGYRGDLYTSQYKPEVLTSLQVVHGLRNPVLATWLLL